MSIPNAKGLPADRSPPTTPRWVRVCSVLAALLFLLVLILHLTGHGFGGHLPAEAGSP